MKNLDTSVICCTIKLIRVMIDNDFLVSSMHPKLHIFRLISQG
jgi:hypothetical protein